MIAFIAVLIALVGLLLMAFSAMNAKLYDIGRILFFCGAFVFTQQLGGKTIKVF